MRKDMIEAHKIVNGAHKVDKEKLFSPFQNNRTRGQ